MKTILNDSELEEHLTNEWEEFMSSTKGAKRIHTVFSEPSDEKPGEWLWSDEDGYHLLSRNTDGSESVLNTDDLDELEFYLFADEVETLGMNMEGEARHNVLELASIVSPQFRRKMETRLSSN